jgi:hypothetical protein
MASRKKRLEIDEDLDQQVIIPTGPTDALAQKSAKNEVKEESEFYETVRKKELHAENVADRKSARTQREKYAGRVFILVSVWITAIFLLLLLQGFGGDLHYRPLTDKVLLTLITSTTVNLIGTLIIVLKYIFKPSQ